MKFGTRYGRRRAVGMALLAAVWVLASGCSGRKPLTYLDDTANFSLIQRVAVLPIANLTGDTTAPVKVQQILSIELLRARAFEVVDSPDVLGSLGRAKVKDVNALTGEQIAAIGKDLQVQALLRGTVQELSVDRSSGVAAPTVSVQLELLDVNTGKTVWSSVASRHGAGITARLFGVGGKSTNEALRELIREALRTLIK